MEAWTELSCALCAVGCALCAVRQVLGDPGFKCKLASSKTQVPETFDKQVPPPPPTLSHSPSLFPIP